MSEFQKQYEVIIIGGSYAGLSAAMSLGRARRKVLVIDYNDPCNVKAPQSHNFLSRDGEPPQQILAQAREQVNNYSSVELKEGIAVNLNSINAVKHEITLADGTQFISQKVILASGLQDTIPAIEGFQECWGKSIIHCPYCHGYEFSDRKTGIFIEPNHAVEMVKLLSNWSNQLIVFPKSKNGLDNYTIQFLNEKEVEVVYGSIQEVIHEDGKIKGLLMDDETEISLEVLYARLPIKQKSPIIEEIGCNMTEQGLIATDDFGETSIKGIYAVGDCTHPLRSIATAVYTGNIAGAMLTNTIVEEEFQIAEH